MRPAAERTFAWVGATVLLGYTLVAWSVGSFYPFSVFPMYAGWSDDTRAARIAARTADHAVVEVTAFRAFDCDATVDPGRLGEACPGPHAYSPRYLDDELAHHVTSHAAEVEDGEPIEIVRRIWTIEDDGSVTVEDCVLARCGAAR